jgi:hypothetical protein
MANTTTSSQLGSSSPSDPESTSHKQGSTSSRPASPITANAPATPQSDAFKQLKSPEPTAASRVKGMSLKEWTANRKQGAEARQLGTLETEKNGNGKRPLDEEEKAIGDAAHPQKKHEGAAACEHVASLEETATKGEDAPAAVKALTNTAATATTTPATAITTTAAAPSKAQASTRATASINTASAYTNNASASSDAPAAPITKATAPSKAPASTTIKASASTKPPAARNTSSAARKTPAASKDPSAAKKTHPAATKVVSKTPVAKKAPAASKPAGVRKTPVASKTQCAPAKGHLAGIMAKVAANTAAFANMTPAASKAPVKAATKKAATKSSKPRPEAPNPKTRWEPTSKEDTIRPAVRSDAQIAQEKAEAWKRTQAVNELAKNPRPNQKLVAMTEAKKAAEKVLEKPRVQGAPKGSQYYLTPPDPFKPKKARAPTTKSGKAAKTKQDAVMVTSNEVVKALADKTNTTASLKRRSEAAGLDGDLESQKKLRRADGTQPARPSGKKTGRNENVPQQSRARTARTMEATEEIEEEEEEEEEETPKRINRKVKMPAPARNQFSDDEDSEFETVTKEEYAALEEDKKAKSAAVMNGTKRARDEVDEEDAPPAPKKAKVAAPAKQASGESNSAKDALTTGSDVSAATPAKKASGESKSGGNILTSGSDAPVAQADQVASPSRKKGVARTTDDKNKKADARRLRRNAKDQAARGKEAAERDAIVRAGGTAVRTENFLKM